jgi:hypothetical protein
MPEEEEKEIKPLKPISPSRAGSNYLSHQLAPRCALVESNIAAGLAAARCRPSEL